MYKNMSMMITSKNQQPTSQQKQQKSISIQKKHFKNESCFFAQKKNSFRNKFSMKKTKSTIFPMKYQLSQKVSAKISIADFIINDGQYVNEKAVNVHEENVMLREKLIQGLQSIKPNCLPKKEVTFQSVLSAQSDRRKNSLSSSRIFVRSKNKVDNKNSDEYSPILKMKESTISLNSPIKQFSRSKSYVENSKKSVQNSLIRKTAPPRMKQKISLIENPSKQRLSLVHSCIRTYGNGQNLHKNNKIHKNCHQIIDKLSILSRNIADRQQQSLMERKKFSQLTKDMEMLWKTDLEINRFIPSKVSVDADDKILELLQLKRLKINSMKNMDEQFVKFDENQKLF